MKKLNIALLAAGISLLFSAPALAAWLQTPEGQWKYEKDGVIVKENWVQEGDSWYYMDANGIMFADTTKNIRGLDYTFDASGKLVSTSAPATASAEAWRFKDKEVGYSIEVPADAELINVEGKDKPYYQINYKGITFGLTHVDVVIKSEPERYEKNVLAKFVDENPQYYFINKQERVGRGDYMFTSYYYGHTETDELVDIYIHHNKEKSQLFVIYTSFKHEQRSDLAKVLWTLRNTALGKGY